MDAIEAGASSQELLPSQLIRAKDQTVFWGGLSLSKRDSRRAQVPKKPAMLCAVQGAVLTYVGQGLIHTIDRKQEW